MHQRVVCGGGGHLLSFDENKSAAAVVDCNNNHVSVQGVRSVRGQGLLSQDGLESDGMRKRTQQQRQRGSRSGCDGGGDSPQKGCENNKNVIQREDGCDFTLASNWMRK